MMLMAMRTVFSASARRRKLPRVRAPAALLVALALVAPSVRADPASDGAAALSLYDAHRRYVEALAHSGWRRDDPRVRVAADEATGVALPILEEVVALRDDARALVQEAAGAPLGAWLRRPDNARDGLLGAWLREHADADLEAAAHHRAPHERVAIALAVAGRRPTLAASLLRTVLRGDDDHHAEACAAAVALPGPLRREFAVSAAARAHRLRNVYCLALYASVPAQRVSFAREAVAILGRRPDGDEAVWATMAAFVTLPVAPPTLEAALGAAFDRYAADDLSHGYLDAVAQVGPWLARAHPRVAAALGRLELRHGVPIASLLPLRVAASDERRLAWLWTLAGDVHHLADERDDTVVQLALALPHRSDVEARAVDAFARARPRLPAYGGRGAVGRLDAWTDAIARVRECSTEACLRAVVATGTSEAAARALVLLGARSLASPETGRVVVERLSVERAGRRVQGLSAADGESVFGAVAFALGAECPDALRPIEGLQAAWGPYPHDVASAWRAAFVARCHERPSPVGR
jgi:hypothetical protein